jgi:hypothetical protein
MTAHNKERIRALEDALIKTRDLVCDGAEEGFNCHVGEWADRLYRNNGDITRALGFISRDKS